MALTDAQWCDAVADITARQITGAIDEDQAALELTAATEDWPTRTLSNSGLALKISKSLSNITGLIETIGPPDPDAGTLEAMAFDKDGLAFYGPKTEAGWGPARPLDAGPAGDNGWVPILAAVSDSERRVFQVSDWTGGSGTKPDVGDYVGPTGLVVDIASAVDVRGAAGADGTDGTNGVDGTDGTNGTDGDNGWTPILANVSDGERRVLQVADWTGGEGTKPATGKYVGATGLVDLIADGVNIRGASGSGAGDVVGPATSINNAVALWDGTTGDLLSNGPNIGTAASGDLLRRSDGDTRYRAAGDVPQSEVTGLTAALAAKANQSTTYSKTEVDGLIPVKASGSDFRVGTNDTKFGTAKSVADALATVAVSPSTAATGLDFSTFMNAEITLATGTLTIGAPSGGFARKTGEIDFVYPASGSATVAWNSNYIVPAGFALQATASGRTSVPYRYQSDGKVRLYNPSKWTS